MNYLMTMTPMTGSEALIFMAICAVGLLICLGIGYRMSRREKR